MVESLVSSARAEPLDVTHYLTVMGVEKEASPRNKAPYETPDTSVFLCRTNFHLPQHLFLQQTSCSVSFCYLLEKKKLNNKKKTFVLKLLFISTEQLHETNNKYSLCYEQFCDKVCQVCHASSEVLQAFVT